MIGLIKICIIMLGIHLSMSCVVFAQATEKDMSAMWGTTSTEIGEGKQATKNEHARQ